MAISSDEVRELLTWFRQQQGEANNIRLVYVSPEEGHTIEVTQDITAGDRLVSIPFASTLTVEAAMNTEVGQAIHAFIKTSVQVDDDEILAFFLMVERAKGTNSKWSPYISVLPKTFDLPIFWSEAELDALRGTMTLVLTRMMKAQVVNDFEAVHKRLLAEYRNLTASDIDLSVEDYIWALAAIWSRAFGIQKNGQYVRVLAPLMDMFNHSAASSYSIDDYIRYDEAAEQLYSTTPENCVAGSQYLIQYGQYCNAKLLYTYGFVCPDNPHKVVDFWVRLPQTDPYYEQKKQLLESLGMWEQAYDFRGTISESAISLSLLTTLRVIMLDEKDFHKVQKIAEGKMASASNELSAYRSLRASLQRKLDSYCSRMEDDIALLSSDVLPSPRRALAARVCLEEKLVLVAMIDTVTQWIHLVETGDEAFSPKVFS